MTQRLLELQAEADRLKADHDALAQSNAGTEAQRKWDDENRQHLAARADLEKQLLALQLAMANVQWLLDFRQQMLSIAPRYQQAVVDAYARLFSVAAGMTKVYGRTDSAGNATDPLPDSHDEAGVDKIIAWTRKSATWLAALTRRTQNYIFPGSLRAVSKEGWAAGKAKKLWTFNVPQTAFDRQCYVRVRGLAAFAIGSDPNDLWTVNLQLPGPTTFVYEGGRTFNLNQGIIKCRISTAGPRGTHLVPDIVGVTSCYNASPIGDRTVNVANSFDPTAAIGLDDIQIYIYLAVLPL